MIKTVIELQNVCKQFHSTGKKSLALDDINLSLREGDIAFLTGHSGAGKSTLLRLIMMLETASSGSIHLNGECLNQLKSRHIPKIRRQIGFIDQSPKLLHHQDAFANVAIALSVMGMHQQDIPARVRAALSMVGLLEKQHSLPHQLSCGEQQRLGIARAIVTKPSILLADEPTGNLDPSLSHEIMQLFEKLNQVGVTILIATHDLSLISQGQHHQFILEKGRLNA